MPTLYRLLGGKSLSLVDATLAALSLLLAVQMLLSVSWPMVQDAPIMLYAADRIASGTAPYRELFDFNCPGAYLVHIAGLKLFGTSDLGLRVLDLIWLGLTMLAAAELMRPCGRQAAWGGAVGVGVLYLSYGPGTSLQRDWLLVLPLMLAALLVGDERRHRRLRLTGAGIAIAAAALIKPQSLIVWPCLRLFSRKAALNTGAESLSTVAWWLWIGLGLLIAALPAVLWLMMKGSLEAFLTMALHYWPLYDAIGSDCAVTTGAGRVWTLLTGFGKLGGLTYWVMTAGLGYYLHWRCRSDNAVGVSRADLLALLALGLGIYPLVGGKFWTYHWLPFGVFVLLLFFAVWFESGGPSSAGNRMWLPISLLLGGMIFGPQPALSGFDWGRIVGGGTPPAKGGRVAALAGFLKENLGPGETVQPLDWTGGAVHAMLLANAAPATSFIYDFHFYHHVQDPYIKALRSRFISELTAAMPRFVIAVDTDKPWVAGPGTTKEFPELSSLIVLHYEIIATGYGCVIYQRAGYPGAAGGVTKSLTP